MNRGHYDVCIVGSGASGALAAEIFVRSGLRTVMVERGRRVAPGTSLLDLIPSFEYAERMTDDGAVAADGYPWSACAVGGGTPFYAGVSFRYRVRDFAAAAHVPSDSLDPTWPLGYEDLADAYTWVERRLGVARGAGDDPCAPPAPRASQPAHPYSPLGERLAEAATALGLHPFPTPVAINSRPFAGGGICQGSTPCTDHVCSTGAKGDVDARVIRRLEGESGFQLLSETVAVRLVFRRGRAVGVRCIDLRGRTAATVSARIIVLAANAIQTAALLLRSAGTSSSDLRGAAPMLGRGLCFKASEYINGWDDAIPPPGSAYAGRFSTMAVTDHYVDGAAPQGMGGLIYETTPDEPFGNAAGTRLRLQIIAPDVPQRENRIALSASTNELGFPRIMIHYRSHELDLRRLAYLRAVAVRMLRRAGARTIQTEPSFFERGSAHLHGTCRAGPIDAESVVDESGRLHGIDNLYVVDGSFMPFPGGLNPTLTIQANAVRIARRLVGTWCGGNAAGERRTPVHG